MTAHKLTVVFPERHFICVYDSIKAIIDSYEGPNAEYEWQDQEGANKIVKQLTLLKQAIGIMDDTMDKEEH